MRKRYYIQHRLNKFYLYYLDSPYYTHNTRFYRVYSVYSDTYCGAISIRFLPMYYDFVKLSRLEIKILKKLFNSGE